MQRFPLQVVKLGGSLLDWPPLAGALTRWLQRQPEEARTVMIAGGGAWADQIRSLDARYGCAQENAHWLAIRAMSLSLTVVRSLLEQACWEDDFTRLQRAIAAEGVIGPSAGPLLFDVHDFLRHHEPGLPGIPLPAGWQVTSDSIAARLAEVLAADRLVLLKSQLPAARTVVQAVREGFVDPFFPTALNGRTQVECINLRHGRLRGCSLTLETGHQVP